MKTNHIKEWKYWSDEILIKVQRFYESDMGYNSTPKHVLVPIVGGNLELPAIDNNYKYALVVASLKKETPIGRVVSYLEQIEKEKWNDAEHCSCLRYAISKLLEIK